MNTVLFDYSILGNRNKLKLSSNSINITKPKFNLDRSSINSDMTKEELKVYNKALKRAYKERIAKEKAEEKIFSFETLLLILNVLLLIPIFYLIVYIGKETGFIAENSYTYPTSLEKSIELGNNRYIKDFYTRNLSVTTLESPLALQNGLYYGVCGKKVDDTIFKYFGNGYINFQNSDKLLKSDKIEVFVSDNQNDIVNEAKVFYGNIDGNLYSNIKPKGNTISYVDMCNVNGKFLLDFEYNGIDLSAYDSIETCEIGDIDIVLHSSSHLLILLHLIFLLIGM